MKRKSTPRQLSQMLGISESRAMESIIKAELISAILKTSEREGFTHAELAIRSGLPRSAVTGILSGSLQKVTIDRVLRLIEAAGLVAEIRVHKKKIGRANV